MLGQLLFLTVPALWTIIWIYKYSQQHSLTWITGTFVFLGLYIPFLVVLLVPLDIVWDVSIFKWRVLYWTTFTATWFILPFIQEYIESQFPTVETRVKDSLYKNLRYYTLLTFLSLVVIAYLRFTLRTMSFANFKELIISLTYFWGLLFVIFLLGNGLVYVPRNIWRKAFLNQRARLLERKAVNIYSRLQERIDEFSAYSSSSTLNMDQSYSLGIRASYATDSDFTSSAVSQAMSHVLPLQTTWTQMVKEYNMINTIRFAKASSSYRLYLPDSYIQMHPVFAYALYVWVIPVFRIFLACFLALLSFVIVVSELFLHSKHSLVGIFLNRVQDSPSLCAFVSFIVINYMRYCTYKSLINTQFASYHHYAVVPFRATGPASLLCFASQLCRLTLPLCYNFTSLQFFPTQFHKFYGESIDLLPLGNLISKRYPVFILMPVIFSLFSLKYWLRHIIYSYGLQKSPVIDSLETESSNTEDNFLDETSPSYLAEGRALLLSANYPSL
ncbi:LMBR1-like membrane protein [Schizosaccharomyces cryophilus OY26]|uniref:LMBR1-like membrane protein n=1 Tax=Schizosaccharomyces cryophilus (strain OY26 / ATCC MYA-4695 / CBS 11777 / NBRC 106824 / NRRL Y48691) TaxID=653667 RepID=S9W0Y5_SCHCR|nr:LMBR1-like membrane protein [Schizosaccharomyces cryophilus OY26]EPY52109.1 LMBR1-like membrane protein [Schizosaccharomyces cryophilus OY26]